MKHRPGTHIRIVTRFSGAARVRLAGTDEAGRACLAGPLVAAACGFDSESLTDAELDRLT